MRGAEEDGSGCIGGRAPNRAGGVGGGLAASSAPPSAPSVDAGKGIEGGDHGTPVLSSLKSPQGSPSILFPPLNRWKMGAPEKWQSVPRPHNLQVVELEFEPRQSACKARLSCLRERAWPCLGAPGSGLLRLRAPWRTTPWAGQEPRGLWPTACLRSCGSQGWVAVSAREEFVKVSARCVMCRSPSSAVRL